MCAKVENDGTSGEGRDGKTGCQTDPGNYGEVLEKYGVKVVVKESDSDGMSVEKRSCDGDGQLMDNECNDDGKSNGKRNDNSAGESGGNIWQHRLPHWRQTNGNNDGEIYGATYVGNSKMVGKVVVEVTAQMFVKVVVQVMEKMMEQG